MNTEQVIAVGGIHERSNLPATSQMSTNTLMHLFLHLCFLSEAIHTLPGTLITPWTSPFGVKLIQSFYSKPFLKILFVAVQILSKGWIACSAQLSAPERKKKTKPKLFYVSQQYSFTLCLLQWQNEVNHHFITFVTSPKLLLIDSKGWDELSHYHPYYITWLLGMVYFLISFWRTRDFQS